jgi:hypothetical protein
LQVPFHGARLIWKTYGFDPQVCEKCTIANQVPQKPRRWREGYNRRHFPRRRHRDEIVLDQVGLPQRSLQHSSQRLDVSRLPALKPASRPPGASFRQTTASLPIPQVCVFVPSDETDGDSSTCFFADPASVRFCAVR